MQEDWSQPRAQMTEAKERESLAPGLPVSLVDHPPLTAPRPPRQDSQGSFYVAMSALACPSLGSGARQASL